MDYLEKLEGFKSAGLDRIHPQVLKDLAEVILKPLKTHGSWVRSCMTGKRQT